MLRNQNQDLKYVLIRASKNRQHLKFTWTTTPPVLRDCRRTSADILRLPAGVRPEYKFDSVLEAFKLFFTIEMVQMVVKCSNTFIDLKSLRISHVTVNEIYAYIGVRLMMGAYNDSSQDILDLWSKGQGRKVYNGAMSRTRYFEISKVIRFDDYRDRLPSSHPYDKIRDFFELFRKQCVNVFNPSESLCVDETLSLFRGNKLFTKNHLLVFLYN